MQPRASLMNRILAHASPGVWITLLVLLPVPSAVIAQRGGMHGPAAVFTTEQAAQGKAIYASDCASCHGRNLSGSEFASPLNGNKFSQDWGAQAADRLFAFIHTRMPPGKAGSLSPRATAQLVAYLIQVNGVSAGGSELPSDPTTLAKLVIPRGPMAPAPPMMPLSPFAPPMVPVVLPNPLDKISAVTDELLQKPPASEWLLWRRTYDDHGFSPLRQITKHNVNALRVAWAWSLPPGKNESTPLEHDGVLFVASYGDKVQALNAVTGDLLWQYSRQLPNDAHTSVKRNLAIYRDRLLVPTSDDHVVALDVKTGTVVWDSPVADYTQGWLVNAGPLVVRGKVLQGVAGQAPGGGSIVALDFESGKMLWRFHTIPRPGEPGGDSWNGLEPHKRSGASVWTAGSYDPQLNLAYFGVGQTYDTGPLLHPVNRPGITNDGLYTDSTLALDPDTGKLVWHFQHVHNDQWDLDWAFEQQLMGLRIGGEQRHLVVTSGKMAVYEAMDAATGKYVFSKDLGIQNVIASIDPRTGEKTINPSVVLGDGKPHTICPHPGGGRNWNATSYNDTTKVAFVPMVESCMDLIPAPKGERGNLSSGVNWTIRPPEHSDGKYGRLEAVDLQSRKVLWIDRQRAPNSTCALATAGGVVFSGSRDRYLRAYEDATGRALWQIRLNDIPSSCPITYSAGGRQYVAVVVGDGGTQTQTFPVLVPEIENPPDLESMIWIFELPETQPAPDSDSTRQLRPSRNRAAVSRP